MREITLSFTLTIRPVRWLRAAAGMCACFPILFTPVGAGRASDARPPDVLARLAAVERIELEIRPRMLPKATEKEIKAVAAVIVDESKRAKVDPLFIVALIQSESGFDIEAVSKTGARGLMQVVPSTFRKMSASRRMFDPVENVRAGIRYVGHLASSGFGRRGGPASVVLAYNQGPGKAAAYFKGTAPMPDEASLFIPRVIGRYKSLLTKFGGDQQLAHDLFRAPVNRLASGQVSSRTTL